MLNIDDDLHPWQPASAPTFQIGDRVRIRLSSECRALFRHFVPGSDAILRRGIFAHLPQEENRIGTIIPRVLDRIPTNDTHCYLVRFDVPILLGRSRILSHGYAASELELLSERSEDDGYLRGL